MTAYDVYDAHECTTESPCLPEPSSGPPPCDNRKPPAKPHRASSLDLGASGSATFNRPRQPHAPPLPPARNRRALKNCAWNVSGRP